MICSLLIVGCLRPDPFHGQPPCWIGRLCPFAKPFVKNTKAAWGPLLAESVPGGYGCLYSGDAMSHGVQAPFRAMPSAFDQDGVVFGQGLLGGLGHADLQNAIFKLGGEILGLYALAHIEAAAAGTGITLLADITALLILFVLIQALAGADGQKTVFL